MIIISFSKKSIKFYQVIRKMWMKIKNKSNKNNRYNRNNNKSNSNNNGDDTVSKQREVC